MKNCKWITLKAQANNKRDILWVDYKGEHIQLTKICEKLGVTYDMVHDRIYKRKWTVDKALETPSARENSLQSKCRERSLNYGTVRDRIMKLGWTEEEALSIPTLGRGANLKSYGHEKKIENRFCKVCGKEFTPSNTRQVYCSKECRKESNHVWYKKKIEAKE